MNCLRMVHWLTLLSIVKIMAQAHNACKDGKLVYERIPGHRMDNGFEEHTYTEITDPSIVVSTCTELCRNDRLDTGDVNPCKTFSFKTLSSVTRLKDIDELWRPSMCSFPKKIQSEEKDDDSLIRDSDFDQFVEICVNETEVLEKNCPNKAHIFTRIPGLVFKPGNEKKIRGIRSRQECENSCLRETEFTCRSANFEKSTKTCSLSTYTIRMMSNRTVINNNINYEYLENNCLRGGNRCEGIPRFVVEKNKEMPKNRDLLSFHNIEEEECRKICRDDKGELPFLCHSFHYNAIEKLCLLSEDYFSDENNGIVTSRSLSYHELVCIQGGQFPIQKGDNSYYYKYEGAYQSSIGNNNRGATGWNQDEDDSHRKNWNNDPHWNRNPNYNHQSKPWSKPNNNPLPYPPGSQRYPGHPLSSPSQGWNSVPNNDPSQNAYEYNGNSQHSGGGSQWTSASGGVDLFNQNNKHASQFVPSNEKEWTDPSGSNGGSYYDSSHPYQTSHPHHPSQSDHSIGDHSVNRPGGSSFSSVSSFASHGSNSNTGGSGDSGFINHGISSAPGHNSPHSISDPHSVYNSNGDKSPSVESSNAHHEGGYVNNNNNPNGGGFMYQSHGSSSYDHKGSKSSSSNSQGGFGQNGPSTSSNNLDGSRPASHFHGSSGSSHGNTNSFSSTSFQNHGGFGHRGQNIDGSASHFHGSSGSSHGNTGTNSFRPHVGSSVPSNHQGKFYNDNSGISLGNTVRRPRCDPGLDKFKQIKSRTQLKSEHIKLKEAVNSLSECEELCIETTSFQCKSFNFVFGFSPKRSDNCEISDFSLESADLNDPNFFQTSDLHDFYMREPRSQDCLDVSQTCTEDEMVFTLRTPSGFNGRIYTYRHYDKNRCFISGTGGNAHVLKIPGASGYPNCGTVKYGNTQTNVVIVQHSELVQTSRDVIYNLTCTVQDPGEAVVTSGYIGSAYIGSGSFGGGSSGGDDGNEGGGGNNGNGSWNFDNGLSGGGISGGGSGFGRPIPIEYLPAEHTLDSRVRLVISYQGRPTTTIAVGDPLEFKIETQDGENLIRDIFATNVIAKDPYSQRAIRLIDNRGCPVDPEVFPALGLSRSGDGLSTYFHAFKIPESNFLVFEANIRTCRGGCPPVDCHGARGRQLSYGKRRKRDVGDQRNETEEIDDNDIGIKEMFKVFDTREDIQKIEIEEKEPIVEKIKPVLNESDCKNKDSNVALIVIIVILLLLITTCIIYIFSVLRTRRNHKNNNVSELISVPDNSSGSLESASNLKPRRSYFYCDRRNNKRDNLRFQDPSEPIYTDPTLFERSLNK
ncbi:uncharacterized protein [Lepeophtheirus salmonis]|uniref:uncharacterized protein isoform X2 n=1 Tax=Lepeophtheirus salmonis TaxID=72036 RepID=UPI001AE1311B|nr:uncharacterized protein LOC121128491 isoform X2 [Lepeophtheirus salmonis]